ncbi:sugar transferase [Patescibacteria group bacterium]|nr:sugar transferase [Patescibacteria group bacterium]
MLNRFLGLFLLLVSLPLMVVIALLVWIFSGWPIFFCQKRVGFRGKIFNIIKFRTMRRDAELLKKAYRQLNEADGPVFKIRNDPRLTRVGKFLFHSGLDEMPQFINMIKGEMVLVGPRPLPVEEERKIGKKYMKREEVRPGIVSPWILSGYHKMKFEDWMESDLGYVKNKSLWGDFKIVLRSCGLMGKLLIRELGHIFQ